eukprot:208958_1
MDAEDFRSYKQEYDHSLDRVRSFLSSGVRSQTTLRECDRLISQARRSATAMEQIAEESGDSFQIQESKRRVEQELNPLWKEVDRAMKQQQNPLQHPDSQNRTELFSGYRAPNLNQDGSDDMEMLIRNSEDLLLESQNLCYASEETGAETLNLMGRQREQLQNAGNHLAGARAYLDDASDILKSMTRKAMRNKRFLQGVVALLVVANILVFIADVKKKLGRGRRSGGADGSADDDGN